MNIFIKAEGVVLLCDLEGIIKEIVYSSIDSIEYFLFGESFVTNVLPSNMPNVLSFLVDLKKNHTAFNYEATYCKNSEYKTMILCGVVRHQNMLLICAHDFGSMFDLIVAMSQIKKEMVDDLRISIVNEYASLVTDSKNHTSLYEEISRLNNELLNTQRELAKKNDQLRRMNEILEDKVTRDHLTGLYNRVSLDNKFLEIKSLAGRLNVPASILIIDINSFKRINDDFGHAQGDSVLISLARILTLNIRFGLDHAFRLGGDEFLVLLTDCDEAGAQSIAERVNDELVKCVNVSIAYGIAIIVAIKEIDINSYIKIADTRMYLQKKKYKLST